jgi:hypothetical protein
MSADAMVSYCNWLDVLPPDEMASHPSWLDVLPPDEMASHPSGLDGFLGGMGLTSRASSVVH